MSYLHTLLSVSDPHHLPCFSTATRRGLNCLGGLFLGMLMFVPSAQALADEEKPIEPVAVDLGREVDYAQDVVPILRKNCIACHNATTKEGSLNLETPADMIKGGDSGEAVIEGDPDSSYLYLVASRESEPVMPPLPNKMNAHKLTGEEVWKLKRWIELGAKGDSMRIKPPVVWSSVPAHLQPVYSLSLFPQEGAVAVGRGQGVEILSLTDPTQVIRLTDPELEGIAHRDFVNAVAVHPSQDLIASAGYRIIKLWERSAPETLATVAGESPVVAAQTSWSGTVAVLADEQGRLRVVSSQQGKNWNSEQTDIAAVAVDDEGRRLALAADKQIRWLDLETPDQVITAESESPVRSLLMVPDGLLAGHEDGVIRLWKRNEENTELQASEVELKKHGNPVIALRRPLSEPAEIVSLAANGEAVLWDWKDKAVRNEWSVGANAADVDYHPAAKRLASLHTDGRVLIWGADKKQERELNRASQLEWRVTAAEEALVIAKALSANTQAQQKAAEKDLSDRKEALTKAEKALEEAKAAHEKNKAPHEEAQTALEAVKKEIADGEETDELKKKLEAATKLAEEKQKAFTESEQAQARAQKTLELEQGSVKRAEQILAKLNEQVEQGTASVQAAEAEVKEAKEAHAASGLAARGVRFVNAGEVQILTEAGHLEHWNVTNGRPLSSLSLADATEAIRWLPLANQQVVIVQASGNCQVVDSSRPWKLRARLGPEQGELEITNSTLIDRVTALAFSPDGKLLASGGGDPSRDGELLLWDWQSGEIALELSGKHSDVVLAMEFSRDGKHLLTGGADKFVRIIEVATGENPISFEGHTEHVLGVSWMADGLTVASSSADKSIKIWNTQDGSQKRTIAGAGKQVTSVQFIGTTDKVVSSGGDKLVRMHQTGNGSNFRNLSGSQNYLYSVAVTRGEELVIAAGQEGIVRIWNAQNGQVLHTLEP